MKLLLQNKFLYGITICKDGAINIYNFYSHCVNQEYNLFLKTTEENHRYCEPIFNSNIYQEYPKELGNQVPINNTILPKTYKKEITLSIITNPKFILEDIEQTVDKFDCCHVLWYYNLKTKQFFIKDTALLSLLSKFWILNEDTNTQLAKNIYMFNRIEKHKKRFIVDDYMLFKYMELCFGQENVEEMFYNYDENAAPLTIKDLEENFFIKLSSELAFSYENFVKFYNITFNKIKSEFLIDNIEERESFKLYILDNVVLTY